jgi:glycosyltransferase involved in cell wall biosynthesis
MNVAYCGPLFDYSGYGEANRHAAAALDAVGIRVIGQPVSYTAESSDFGKIGQTMQRLSENKGKYSIKIIHTTPDQYTKYMEDGLYHIGHFFWETDGIPEDFVAGLKLMDEIWTGSDANADAIRRSLPDAIIRVYPQAIETEREWPETPYEINNFDGFLFYSIFEWTDRKNPQALLEAYWQEFQNNENVGLLIKTYFRNFDLKNKRMIRDQIAQFKRKSGLDKFPRVFLYMDLMDRSHIMRLHKTGNCYVSPHRGEGWGLPIAEAALAGNPIIATGYGGIAEWMKKADAAMILDYEMVPLKGMAHSAKWYTPEQRWADPDCEALRANMRLAFEQGPEVDDITARGVKLVQSDFSLSVVGEEMAGRLKRIESAFPKARSK